MIRTRKELDFYIKADLMMRTGSFTRSLPQKIINLIKPDYVFEYIRVSRKYSYYSHQGANPLLALLYGWKRRKLGFMLGFTIAVDEIGYGLMLPHHGTIVVGDGNRIGNYAVLFTSTCITEGNREIGDGFYLGCGAKVVRDLTIGDYVSVGANSLVNRSFPDRCMVAGVPAQWIKESEPWYVRDGAEFSRRVNACEKLKREYQIPD